MRNGNQSRDEISVLQTKWTLVFRCQFANEVNMHSSKLICPQNYI
jgi:hypothetical protein